LRPRYLPEVLGKKATSDLEKGAPFELKNIE
jgi:hypothetical protein